MGVEEKSEAMVALLHSALTVRCRVRCMTRLESSRGRV